MSRKRKNVEENNKIFDEDRMTLPLLRKTLETFSKLYLENQIQRQDHPDNPRKFEKSEIDLLMCLQNLRGITLEPSLYTYLINHKTGFSGILEGISHESLLISSSIVSIISEALEEDPENLSSEEHTKKLLDALLKGSLIERICTYIQKFPIGEDNEKATKENEQEKEKEKEEEKEKEKEKSLSKIQVDEENSEMLYTGFNLIETIYEFRPEIVSKSLISNEKFLNYLISGFSQYQINVTESDVDANIGYCAELLAIIVQTPIARESPKLFQMVLKPCLNLLTMGKKTKHSPDQKEFMNNLFDILSSLLLNEHNKDLLLSSGSLDSLISIMKAGHYRSKALSVIEMALSNSHSSCDHFVNVSLGLGPLFHQFMKKKKMQEDENKFSQRQCRLDRSLFSCILSLLFFGSKITQARTLAKFVERKYQKIDVLFLYFETYRLQIVSLEQQEDNSTEWNEKMVLIESIFYKIALLFAQIWIKIKSLKKRINKYLPIIRSTLEDYYQELEQENQQTKNKSVEFNLVQNILNTIPQNSTNN
ncbi:beta-catenin-like protein [Anaeramoeba flamelloides]|uniref:Beta-catenin-like protein n=1 Tax=Anaeramoeba flamelloides TaxID=1746091 RepID=A0AAV7YJC1_9EUKA|nr:beta-catenin-like protein [Anaeramoeba flamelloides]